MLSQKRVLVKNLERFPCRSTTGIIALNVYRILLPLAVITSSVFLSIFVHYHQTVMCCWDRLLSFFCWWRRDRFLPMDHDWCSSLRSFSFQLPNLALVKVIIAFQSFPKNLCPFILFLFCACGDMFFYTTPWNLTLLWRRPLSYRNHSIDLL